MLRKRMYLGIKKYISYLFVLVFAFAIGMLAPEIRSDFIQADASIGNYGDGTFEDDLIELHTTMNDLTNYYLENLLDDQVSNVEYVANPEDCSGENLSTYCLAVVLNTELHAFELTLAKRSEEIEPGVTNLEEALNESSSRKNFIETELFAARETLELTLSVYNEIQNVYPTHKALLSTIINLENYRNNLKDLRDVIELYPDKFNDASTIQCK